MSTADLANKGQTLQVLLCAISLVLSCVDPRKSCCLQLLGIEIKNKNKNTEVLQYSVSHKPYGGDLGENFLKNRPKHENIS